MINDNILFKGYNLEANYKSQLPSPVNSYAAIYFYLIWSAISLWCSSVLCGLEVVKYAFLEDIEMKIPSIIVSLN